jgi:glycosyltransferase involved in cell wall biosynthesis
MRTRPDGGSTSGRSGVHGATIPLSSLRPDLEHGWPLSTIWIATPENEGATSLEHPLGTTVSFRLRRFSESRLRARVSLAYEHGYSPTGAARARVLLRTGGRHLQIWSGLLGGIRPLPQGPSVSLDVELPDEAKEADLLLCASPLRPRSHPAARIRWHAPVLEPREPQQPLITFEKAGDHDRNGQSPTLAKPLLISILTPVHNPPPQLLRDTLESVRSQTYRDWELCLVDDGSSEGKVIEILEHAATADDRIQLQRRPQARGISAATNDALHMATGQYIALLDHDDLLHPEALELIASELAADPDLDMVYSDEEMIEGERQVAIFRKPSWSQDLMLSHMYTCHLGVYRRSLAEEIGGFRSAFDGAQDYDFVLRVSERTSRIGHVPRVLYRWRAHAGSAADNLAAKPHAYSAARRAIADHLRRTERNATVHFGALRSWYWVDADRKDVGPVSLVLAAPELTQPLLDHIGAIEESWRRGNGSELELAIAAPDRLAEEWERALASFGGSLRIVTTAQGAGKAEVINCAVEASEGGQMVLLAAPLEALSTHALTRLAAFASQRDIGLVAPKELTPDGRVQSIGAILRDGLPVPVQLGVDQIEQGPLAVLQVSANFGAVMGTVAIARDRFEQLGGLSAEFDELAIADLCLRAWDEGLRIVSTPDVVLRRLPGSPAPVNDLVELSDFRARWLPRLPADPYYDGELAMTLLGATPASPASRT